MIGSLAKKKSDKLYRNKSENQARYKLYQKNYRDVPENKLNHIQYQERYKKKYPGKRKAVADLNNAVRNGKIKRKRCVVCYSVQRVHGHHPDYSKPFDVEWLCDSCHRLWHKILSEWERKENERTRHCERVFSR